MYFDATMVNMQNMTKLGFTHKFRPKLFHQIDPSTCLTNRSI
jgi:hypothetical protein